MKIMENNRKKTITSLSKSDKENETKKIEVDEDEITASTNFSDKMEFTVEDINIKTDLDPQLQKIILSRDKGQKMNTSFVQESIEGELVVDVLAVLRNPEEEVPGLNVVSTIGDVVTGTVEINKIEEVEENPNVISLKGAREVSPHLSVSIPEIRARQSDIQTSLKIANQNIDGTGVIVGIVDYGCDFTHENFLKPDGTTRILYLWDQFRQQNSMSPKEYPYGREFSSEQINTALHQSDPYSALSYNLEEKEHGTHVMDIAAGNGRGSGSSGVAPKADIIFVHLSSERNLENFGNSRRLLEAVEYIFRRAESLGKSAVVNLSLGTHGGPHDGSTPVERGLDFLLSKPGRAVVISAGNSWMRKSHASGRLLSDQSRNLGWEIFNSDTTSNELEVWYNGDSELEVTLITPAGQRVGTARLNETKDISLQGNAFARIIHRASDPLNGENQVNIFLLPGISGIWNVELKTISHSASEFHAWIERDDDNINFNRKNQSKFIVADADPTSTIGSISCGKHSIVVGSYNAAVIKRDISSFSSEGPTRDGKQKPEVSAPGHEIRAANSGSQNGIVSMSGTSMAAPHITGVVALLMQIAGKPLTITDLRSALTSTARREFNANNDWDSRYGNGRVDTIAALSTQVSSLPISELTSNSELTSGTQLIPSLNSLLNLIANGSQGAKIRLRLEVEVEPVYKH